MRVSVIVGIFRLFMFFAVTFLQFVLMHDLIGSGMYILCIACSRSLIFTDKSFDP
ncbi:hypothetical protein AHAS_Ahas14G0026900 [Arachis hypogaea]